MTAPFHRVGFADFWLADQLNSLVVVLMDLEYMICFYSFELDWTKHNGLISRGEAPRCSLLSRTCRSKPVAKCRPLQVTMCATRTRMAFGR